GQGEPPQQFRVGGVPHVNGEPPGLGAAVGDDGEELAVGREADGEHRPGVLEPRGDQPPATAGGRRAGGPRGRGRASDRAGWAERAGGGREGARRRAAYDRTACSGAGGGRAYDSTAGGTGL